MEIPAGVNEHCTDIAITDDSVGLEGSELFTVTFDMSQLPDGMELGLVNSTNIRITDDDSKKTRLCNTNKSLVVLIKLLVWCLMRRAIM